MSVAWLSYLPVPGLSMVAIWADPHDRSTRFHAWQGGVLVGGLYASVIVFALLSLISDAGVYQTIIGLLTGLTIIAGLVGIVMGAIAAGRGRYLRIRPAWDMVAALKR